MTTIAATLRRHERSLRADAHALSTAHPEISRRLSVAAETVRDAVAELCVPAPTPPSQLIRFDLYELSRRTVEVKQAMLNADNKALRELLARAVEILSDGTAHLSDKHRVEVESIAAKVKHGNPIAGVGLDW